MQILHYSNQLKYHTLTLGLYQTPSMIVKACVYPKPNQLLCPFYKQVHVVLLHAESLGPDTC